MHRNADRACLIGKRTGDRLLDPPGRIGAELISLCIIKLLYCLDQSEIAFLNQIEQLHPTSCISFGNADYKSQICLHKLLTCILISPAHFFCQLDLFFRT